MSGYRDRHMKKCSVQKNRSFDDSHILNYCIKVRYSSIVTLVPISLQTVMWAPTLFTQIQGHQFGLCVSGIAKIMIIGNH